MNSELENIVIVGCSRGGYYATSYLIPRVDVTSSSVVLISHLEDLRIYKKLEKKRININRITMSNSTTPEFKSGYVYVVNGPEVVDDTMKRLSEHYLDRCISVILSGRGDDGAEGSLRIKEGKGRVLVQTEGLLHPSFFTGYCNQMPQNTEIKVQVDFSGPLRKLVSVLNNYLSKDNKTKWL